MVLEFGRRADSRAEETAQDHVFQATYPVLAAADDAITTNGYVGASVWWSLNDYWTMVPGISVEHFGLFAPDGSARRVAGSLSSSFAGGAGEGASLRIASGGKGQPVEAPQAVPFAVLLAFSLAFPLAVLLLLLAVLSRAARRRLAAAA